MEVKSYSLAILGDAGSGKTSFANRFTQNSFNPNEKPTIGAEYFQKIFNFNNQFIKLDIYCSSGDEKYRKISKYLYKEARSVILMYKINDENSFSNIKHYLDNIRQFSIENPIIYLVGNFGDAIDERQVNMQEIKEFAQEQELKSFEISCKIGTGVDEVVMDLTKEIILTGKWYITKIFKDLQDISSYEKAEKENEKLKKNLKNYYKDKKPNYIRCQGCDKLFIIRFKAMFNEVSFICNNCEFETNVPISNVDNYIENLSNRIICCECKKKNEAKYKLKYCPECKEYLCQSCEKIHDKKAKSRGEPDDHYLCPYFLMDISCFKDSKKNIGYCKICKKSFCSKCNNEHKKHEFMYFEDFIEQLIKEGKDNIQREISLIKAFKKNCDDCLETLRKTINHFINIKEKEIKLKDQLLNQLSNIQYNYQLIETVRNFRFIKKIKYDQHSYWDQKLTDIFEVLGLPIQIKSINISKDRNTSITPEEIRIGCSESPLESDDKDITDICSMNNNKYVGVSFSNGSLELYDNLIKSQDPLSVFQILENGQSINSIQKSTRNVNNFLICGQYKIKTIEFYDNYKSYKTINELIDEDKIFLLCLEQNDYILTCDVFNKLEIFSKENKKLEDLSDCIDPSGSKHILSLNEISNDKIYINFNKLTENTDKLIGRGSLSFGDLEDYTIDLSESGNTIKQPIELGTKIVEINYNRIKREYLLPSKQEVIGVIHEKFILIRDEANGSVILFDVSTFKNSQRFYWDLGGKPIYCGILNKRLHLIDFIVVDDKMNIYQNIYDEETKSITQISGLKNKNEGLEIDPENLKRGKIVQNPFKSIVNYIGDNNFIVVNY